MFLIKDALEEGADCMAKVGKKGMTAVDRANSMYVHVSRCADTFTVDEVQRTGAFHSAQRALRGHAMPRTCGTTLVPHPHPLLHDHLPCIAWRGLNYVCVCVCV